MKRVIPVLLVLLAAIVATFLGDLWHSDAVYGEYDRSVRGYLAKATQIIGQETIKFERLSDKFTVPQKLTIKGTPYDIGLTIGHMGRQANARVPLLAETNRALNQKLTDLYRRVYPQQLEVVRGVAAAYECRAEQIDLVLFERDFTPNLWCDMLQNERFYRETDFGEQSDPIESHHCSAASYYLKGHQIVGRNFDLPSDRPHYFLTLEMAGTYKVMGHTIYDITGEVDDGINEKGFALCVAANISVRREARADASKLCVYEHCE